MAGLQINLCVCVYIYIQTYTYTHTKHNMYIYTHTQCHDTYVTLADQIGDKLGFEISRESHSKPNVTIIVIFQFVKKSNVQHLL